MRTSLLGFVVLVALVAVQAFAPPAAYRAVRFDGRVSRLEALPVRLPSAPEEYQLALREAAETWNRAGIGQVFVLDSPQSDLAIDWTGRGLEDASAARTTLSPVARGRLQLAGLSVRAEGREHHVLRHILTHELGHVLGLEHSEIPGDVMFCRHQNGSGRLSNRDRRMLRWLYRRPEYTPLLASRVGQGG